MSEESFIFYNLLEADDVSRSGWQTYAGVSIHWLNPHQQYVTTDNYVSEFVPPDHPITASVPIENHVIASVPSVNNVRSSVTT